MSILTAEKVVKKVKTQSKKDFDTNLANPTPVAIKLEELPAEIKGRRIWCLWSYRRREGDDRWTKVPFQPVGANKWYIDHVGENWRKAKSSDPRTHSSYEKVVETLQDFREDFDGIGIFLRGDVAGSDLDNCRDRDTGTIKPWAKEILDEISTYTEVSPSGTGCKYLCFGVLATIRDEVGIEHNRDFRKKKKREDGDGEVEVYDKSSNRFFTLTGNRLHEHPGSLQHRQGELSSVYKRVFAPEISVALKHNKQRTRAEKKYAESNPLDIQFADRDILKLACSAKNKQKFKELYLDGSLKHHGMDHSVADFALCSMIAFYTGPDPKRIDRIFRTSALCGTPDRIRKWDRLSEQTIDRVICKCTEFYNWDAAKLANKTAEQVEILKKLIKESRERRAQETAGDSESPSPHSEADQESDAHLDDGAVKKKTEHGHIDLTPLQAWGIALKRPREPFIENMSTYGDSTILFGPAGGGKSEIVKHIIHNSIFGEDFFGHRMKKGHHLYLDPENGQNTLYDLYRMCGCEPNAIMDIPDPFSDDFDTMAEKHGENFRKLRDHVATNPKLQELEKYLTIVDHRPEEYGPAMLKEIVLARREVIGNARLSVYLDTFRHLHANLEDYDEDKSKCIQPLLDEYNVMARELNISLWHLHHTVKSNAGKGVGSGAFYNAISNVLIYERQPDDFMSNGTFKVYRSRGNPPVNPFHINYDPSTRRLIHVGIAVREDKTVNKVADKNKKLAKDLKHFPKVEAEAIDATTFMDDDHADIESTTTANRYIKDLEAKGYLEKKGKGGKGDVHKFWVSQKGKEFLMVQQALAEMEGLDQRAENDSSHSSHGMNNEAVG